MHTQYLPPAVTTWLTAHGPQVLTLTTTIGILGGFVLITRAVRRGHLEHLAVTTAVLLASGFSAQGMWEVATQRLHLPGILAAGLFTVAEAAMLASAIRADHHWHTTSDDGRSATLGVHGRFVFAIATVAGIAVSLNAHSPSEYILRLAMPVLAASLWRLGYTTTDRSDRPPDAMSWRWTPRRIGVVLGVIEPGDRDVTTIHRERRIRVLTTHAHGLHHGPHHLRFYHTMRLRRLTLLADDAMIAEVQARVNRVHHIQRATAPIAEPEPPPDATDTDTADGGGEPPAAAARTAAPRTRRPSSAARVAAAARRSPGATTAVIAARAGVSETTARRHLKPPTATGATAN